MGTLRFDNDRCNNESGQISYHLCYVPPCPPGMVSPVLAQQLVPAAAPPKTAHGGKQGNQRAEDGNKEKEEKEAKDKEKKEKESKERENKEKDKKPGPPKLPPVGYLCS